MKLRTLVSAVSLFAVASACASSGSDPYDSYRGVPSPSRAADSGANLVVQVSNGYYLPMRIFVDWPHEHHFLGDVGAGGQETFQLPANLVGRYPTLRLYGQPEGSAEDIQTEPLEVEPGRQVTWQLTKVLDASRAWVM